MGAFSLRPSAVVLVALMSVGLSRHSEAGELVGCSFNGIDLWGEVEIVDSFPDITVRRVDSFPDLHVEMVDSYPDACGQWEIVDSFPDFTIEFVDSFPDIEIEVVDSYPGLP